MLAAVAALMAASAPAQEKKPRTSPRALAVVMLPPKTGNVKTTAVPKLYPISILQNGTYFDATIYEASPVPMALEPGTVYEVQRSGDPQGLFVISDAERGKENWYAKGEWKPGTEEAATMPKPEKPAHTAIDMSDDEGRPILRRSGAPSNTPAQAPAPVPAAPPVTEAKTSSPSNDDEVFDPNRPRLRHRKEGSAQAPTPSTQVEQKSEARSFPLAAGVALPPVSLLFPAISDSTPYQTQSYIFPWKPEEQSKLTAGITRIALRELQQYWRRQGINQKIPLRLDEFEVRAFDLYTNNDVELVLTARQLLPSTSNKSRLDAPAASQDMSFYITVVGMMDSSGELRKLFSSVTDNEHLDVQGRLEFIDAVDADGDGRGELLFRRIGFDTQTFELYHAGRDQLWKLFAGAEMSR